MHQLTAQQLANVHAVSDHDINPVTGELVFTWNARGEPSLYLLPSEGGEPEPLVIGQSQFASWAPDGEWLVYLRDAGGAEADDVILFSSATKVQYPLTDDAFTYTWPRFAPDGRLAVISNRAGSFDPYFLDRETRVFQRIAVGERAASSLNWSPSGRYLGYFRLAEPDRRGNQQSALHLYDGETGEDRVLALLGGDLFHAEWSWKRAEPEPKLCVPADRDEFQGLLLLSVHGDQRWLELDGGDKLQPHWSPDGRQLAFLCEQMGNRFLRVLDVERREQKDLSVGNGIHRQPRWSPDGRSLTIIFESATRPPDLWRVMLSGAQKQLTQSLPEEFPAHDLTPAEHVTYPSFDGWEIPALLYTPREANGAAVVWVHGGPAGSHRNGWYPDLQLLTNLGYTVLAPNIRGSSGYGKTFRDLNHMDWGGGDLKDLGAAHSFLRRHGFDHVGIMGGSLGGYLTLMALTKQPNLWDAGAALYPIADLRTLYYSTRPGDLRSYLEDHIGTPDENPTFFYERSPINFVDQIQAPLLMIQGANDPRTPLSEAKSMARQLAAMGKLHDLHVYPNEGHGLQKRENREDAFNRVLAFFNEYLYLQ